MIDDAIEKRQNSNDDDNQEVDNDLLSTWKPKKYPLLAPAPPSFFPLDLKTRQTYDKRQMGKHWNVTLNIIYQPVISAGGPSPGAAQQFQGANVLYGW